MTQTLAPPELFPPEQREAYIELLSSFGIEAKYSPTQPRDAHGRWSHGVAVFQRPGPDIQRLHRELRENGGFSFQPFTGHTPTDGFMVSIYPDREQQYKLEQCTPDAIKRYINKNADLLVNPDNYAGGWYDQHGDRVYLDVSRRTQTLDEAVRLGKEHGQLAVYDVARGDTVEVSTQAQHDAVVGKDAPESAWTAKERQRQPWYDDLESRVLAQYGLIRERVGNAIRSGDNLDEALGRALSGMEDDWAAILMSAWMDIGLAFAHPVVEGKADDPSFIQDWRDRYMRFIRDQAAKRVTGIDDTVRDDLRRVIGDALKQTNPSQGYVARYVDEVLTKTWAGRAKTIARTEVCTASDVSQYAAVQAAVARNIPSGLPDTTEDLEKVWDTVTDGRERDSHREMDGVVVPFDEPFIVNGESMLYPHDSSLGASANETINCRCTYRVRPRTQR